jgi:hypothetical protein
MLSSESVRKLCKVTNIFKAFTELNGEGRQICNTVVLFGQSFCKLHEVVKWSPLLSCKKYQTKKIY